MERLIAQVALAFPKMRILCADDRLDKLYSLKRSLERMTGEHIQIAHQAYCPDDYARISACTFGICGRGEVDLHNRDLVFTCQAIWLQAREYGQLVYRDADQARLFGFLPLQYRTTQRERDQLHSFYGPVLTLHREDRVERAITVGRLPFRQKLDGKFTTKVELLRSGVWCQPIRNRIICQIARSIAEGDFRKIAGVVAEADYSAMMGDCLVSAFWPRILSRRRSFVHAFEAGNWYVASSSI